MIHLIKEGFQCSEKLPSIEETRKVIMERLGCELGFEDKVSSSNTG